MEPGCFDITKDIRRTSTCKCTLYWEKTMWQQQDIYIYCLERERKSFIKGYYLLLPTLRWHFAQKLSNFNQENTLGSGEINKSLK